MKKICVVTGTRAEYGQLRPLMEMIDTSVSTQLQLVVTGTHLSPEFGLTYQEIEADGFKIDRKIEALLSSDTPVGIGKSTGLGVIGFADVFADIRPELVVLLGDRYEVLAAAIAALYARIPIAHLHGGETTEGAFDEGIRHAITKLSHLHFVAAEDYHTRVLQLGEAPEHVYCVGGLGVDAMRRVKLLEREDLEKQLNFKFGKQTLLITFHPVTLETDPEGTQIDALLNACTALDKDVSFIFTMPNADTGGRIIIDKIQQFVTSMGNRAMASTSLGQLRYWSALPIVDAVVGNSSSGISEAPTFGIPTVNIGDRQKGRLMADSIINCKPESQAIETAIRKALSKAFRNHAKLAINPYGTGGAAEKIFEVINSAPLANEALLKKKFYDL